MRLSRKILRKEKTLFLRFKHFCQYNSVLSTHYCKRLFMESRIRYLLKRYSFAIIHENGLFFNYYLTTEPGRPLRVQWSFGTQTTTDFCFNISVNTLRDVAALHTKFIKTYNSTSYSVFPHLEPVL